MPDVCAPPVHYWSRLHVGPPGSLPPLAGIFGLPCNCGVEVAGGEAVVCHALAGDARPPQWLRLKLPWRYTPDDEDCVDYGEL